MDGPAMVLAGPGSGKTMVITNRIRHLIENGVRPEQILVITFTRAAARQMQERFEKLCASESSRRVSFGTFHAVFFQILRHAYGYTSENILRDEERYRIVMQIAGSMNIECGDMKEWAGDVLAEISRVKSEQIPIEYYYSATVPEEDFRKIYSLYIKMQQQMRKVDFDDMCVYTADLFHGRSDILKAWQERFRYILVDEFQDINLLQYKIVRLLAAPQDNLFIVGDDDQSIYRFRGSRPEIMLGFGRDYPSAKTFQLRENYRSTAAIVSASVAVISENKNRYVKDLYSKNPDQEPVEVMECGDVETQMLYLVKSIRSSLESGLSPSDIAVLTRTNLESRAPAQRLAEFQVPCRVKDAVPVLWDHWIAGDFMAYLSLAGGRMDRGDFLRVCNRPNRYITRQSAYAPVITFDGLHAYYQDKPWMREHLEEFEDTLEMIRSMKPYAAVNFIRKGGGYDTFLREYASRRRVDCEELLQIADEIQDSARGCADKGEWEQKISRMREELARQRENAKKADSECVTLATLHGAKGLEFTEVFLLNVNEGVIPYRRAGTDAEIEEERRLFYVGMTRAKKKLHLLYVKQRYNKSMEPSRFLDPLRTMRK